MDYTELELWQRARSLAKEIYIATTDFPSREMFGLTHQMRRAAISVPSNVAEGCGRRTNMDTLRFVHIALGSIYEIETQCVILQLTLSI